MEYEELASRLKTIVGIPVTPFDGSGALDEAALIRVINRAQHPNIGVLTPNGNTSEFYALSPEERVRCVELAVENCGDAIVMAGVGLDVDTAIAAGRRAHDAGASMVMIHQPPHPYRSLAGWLEYHRLIAEALPDLGIVPYLRDAAVTPEVVSALAEICPNLVGVKYAVPDLSRFGDMIAQTDGGRFTWICGLAETWSPFAWLLGAHAYTSGLINVAPAATGRMFQYLTSGDYDGAMEIWRRFQPFEQLRNDNQGELNVSAVKEALFQLGVCGDGVRAPISKVPEPGRERIRAFIADLRAAGLLEAA